MRVFVTGATGFVGSAVVQELLQGGHEVTGLARSDAGAAALVAVGVTVLRGDLDDLDSLRAGANAAQGVIHIGFNHDFSKFAANCETDRLAITAMGEVLAGSDRPLIVTSGTALPMPDQVVTEDTAAPLNMAIPRVSEQTALALQGVNAMVVRLPPSTHGDGDHGFVPLLIDIARDKGVSVYSGGGLNNWAAVHRLDAARVFNLVLENGVGGVRYHAVAEQGIPFRQIAEVIGRRLGVPVVSMAPADAAAHFGWFAHFAAINTRASSALTQSRLGWTPVQPGLIADLDDPRYFG
ncbi:MAG: SDR family oxidoreductase [Paracoccaceae bacterium]